MTHHGYTLFDTTIGWCGIAWGGRGVTAVQLPEAHEPATRDRLLQRSPGAPEALPPAEVRLAVDGIVSLLAGEATDLSFVTLDMGPVPPFHQRVYEVTRDIPAGSTQTYGQVAARLGAASAARAVGQALGRNPFPLVVPCHRVLAAGGKVGGFSANGGATTKLRLLEIEGVRPTGARTPFDSDLGFDPCVAVGHLRAADPQLAHLIDRVGPFDLRPETAPSLFAALAQAIVYQQLSGKAAATIHGRLCALFPQALSAEQLLSASDEQLRSAGVSRPKVRSLRDLAQRTVAGELPSLAQVRHMTDDAIIERLTTVRGIGRWTAEMLLIFRLGRPDVLPLDDLGIRKGFAIAFATGDLPDRRYVEERGARWRPYRTVASWYLWRAAETSW